MQRGAGDVKAHQSQRPLLLGLPQTSLHLLQPPSLAPLTALAWLQSLGGHGPPGCNPAMPEGWHLPLSCMAMKCNANLDFLVPKFSVPITALSVSQKSSRNYSLSLGSHRSSADTRHVAASSPNSSCCKFLTVFCCHSCCF